MPVDLRLYQKAHRCARDRQLGGRAAAEGRHPLRRHRSPGGVTAGPCSKPSAASRRRRIRGAQIERVAAARGPREHLMQDQTEGAPAAPPILSLCPLRPASPSPARCAARGRAAHAVTQPRAPAHSSTLTRCASPPTPRPSPRAPLRCAAATAVAPRRAAAPRSARPRKKKADVMSSRHAKYLFDPRVWCEIPIQIGGGEIQQMWDSLHTVHTHSAAGAARARSRDVRHLAPLTPTPRRCPPPRCPPRRPRRPRLPCHPLCASSKPRGP